MKKLAIALGVAAMLLVVGCAKKEEGGGTAGTSSPTTSGGSAGGTTTASGPAYLGMYTMVMPAEVQEQVDKAKAMYEETKKKADAGDAAAKATLPALEESMKQMAEAENFGLELKDGGKYSMKMMGQEMTGDYKVDGDSITLQPPTNAPDKMKSADDKPVTGKIDEAAGTIVLEDRGTKLEFKKKS